MCEKEKWKMGLIGSTMPNEHIIYLLGAEAVCPECKGMMRDTGVSFFCNDCRRVFVISDDLDFDRKVKIREVSKTVS